MSSEEMEQVAIAVAEKLNGYQWKARVKVVIPLRGFHRSAFREGRFTIPFQIASFLLALKGRLDTAIEMTEVDSDINSPTFAKAVADELSKAFKGLPLNE